MGYLININLCITPANVKSTRFVKITVTKILLLMVCSVIYVIYNTLAKLKTHSSLDLAHIVIFGILLIGSKLKTIKLLY